MSSYPDIEVECFCIDCEYRGASIQVTLNGRESRMFECEALFDECGERIWVAPWNYCCFGDVRKEFK